MRMKRCLQLMSAALLVAAPAVADDWSVPGDFSTIQDAINSVNVNPGDRIFVGPGTFFGATVTKSVEIIGIGVAVIDDGPNTHSFLRAGFYFAPDYSGNGAKIRGFIFQGAQQMDYVDDAYLDFGIFSRGADAVTVEHCGFLDCLQAISNWAGSGWNIRHNRFEGLWTLNGGGIAILVGDRFGGMVTDNLISHNKIGGFLSTGPLEKGGYAGSGIVLYADFRYGQSGSAAIKSNRVVKNTIALTSFNPTLVDVVAIELTDTRGDPNAVPYPVIFDNAVGFNDVRGTVLTLVLIPEELEDCNYISRNLGITKSNRGQGLHPEVFGPVVHP